MNGLYYLLGKVYLVTDKKNQRLMVVPEVQIHDNLFVIYFSSMYLYYYFITGKKNRL